MADKRATKRKREAAVHLRALAVDLQIAHRGRNADLNKTDFGFLFSCVLASCKTPEQTQRAEKAKNLYDGVDVAAAAALPAVPLLPGTVQVLSRSQQGRKLD